MARQKGIIKLQGSIGDITFYKTQDGYLAREKGGIDKERFLNDPKFQRTRENALEFGRAGKSTKLLSSSIRPVLNKIKDSRMTSRLVKTMMALLKTDAVNARGSRHIAMGNFDILRGFDFNSKAPLTSTIYAPYSSSLNRSSGVSTIDFNPFSPDAQIIAPRGTTHFRLISASLDLNLLTEEFKFAQSISENLSFAENTPSVSLVNSLDTNNSVNHQFLFLGIEFLQEVNGDHYPLNNGSFNALKIITIEVPG